MIKTLIRSLGRSGFRKGLGREPGGRGWLVIGVLAWLIRFVQRKKDEPKVQMSERLEPGQVIVIRHLAKDEAV